MDLPEALKECADLLNIAAFALRKVVGSEVATYQGAHAQEYLSEVLQLAARLKHLSRTITVSSNDVDCAIADHAAEACDKIRH